MSQSQQPDWSSRMPGEQWVMMDSVDAAEAYLTTYAHEEVQVLREEFPNPRGLYARIRFPGRIAQHHVFVTPGEG